MSSSAAPQRKSKGRQKVKMVKMENHSNLQVTFSKRRAGLFKKASELCTLCGAEAAILVFSPANKPYCFGHPNVKSVVDRLAAAGMDHPPPQPDPTRSNLIIDAHRNSNIRDLNIELTRVESLLRAERRRAEEIEAVRKSGPWLPTLDEMGLDELGQLEEAVVGFKKDFEAAVLRVANLDNSLIGGGGGGNSGFDFPRLSLGFGDVSFYLNGGVGDYSTANNGGDGGGYYGWGGGVFNVGGGSNGASSSSSIIPHDPHSSSGDFGGGLFHMSQI